MEWLAGEFGRAFSRWTLREFVAAVGEMAAGRSICFVPGSIAVLPGVGAEGSGAHISRTALQSGRRRQICEQCIGKAGTPYRKRGCGPIIKLSRSPEMIFIAGDITSAWHRFGSIIEKEAQELTLMGLNPRRICPRHDGDIAHDFAGAAALVFQRRFVHEATESSHQSQTIASGASGKTRGPQKLEQGQRPHKSLRAKCRNLPRLQLPSISGTKLGGWLGLRTRLHDGSCSACYAWVKSMNKSILFLTSSFCHSYSSQQHLNPHQMTVILSEENESSSFPLK